MKTALVIGAGPAGLMAAEVLSAAGVQVTVTEKMPSVGRKFLMAGKSGLNLTKAEPANVFASQYFPPHPQMAKAIKDFDADAVQDWAKGLGQTLFVGSTGRVFPKVMKASPLLRAWLKRLEDQSVTIHTRWTWTGWDKQEALFTTPEGAKRFAADITILALGGASWARLGSDGAWAKHIPNTMPFQPANMGFQREWSKHMDQFLGQPVKNIALTAGASTSRGEIVLTQTGIEGGGIYEVSRAMRDGAPLTLDLFPDQTQDVVNERWSRKSKKATLSRFLKSGLRLSPIKIALFNEVIQNGQPRPAHAYAELVKALPIHHSGPHDMDQAISTAGGVAFDSLDSNWMLKEKPGVFCAGEMLDWEAPTGGYLITGCLATGHAAAVGALK